MITNKMAHDAAVAYYGIENPDIPFDTLPLERIQDRRRCARAALEAVVDALTVDAVAEAERACELAERYGEALTQISEILQNDPTPGAILKARTVIVGVGEPVA